MALRSLLGRGPAALTPPIRDSSPDRAPDSLAAGVAQPLRGELEALLDAGRVLSRPGDLIRYASDASPYRRFPRAVVMAKEPGDVAKVLAFGRVKGIPVTFRAGGTSLNGQGQTDGILVDVRRHFGGLTVLDDGAAVRVGTGTILGHVNRVLAPLGRRLGPDPASTTSPPSVGSLQTTRAGCAAA
jgi:D-lactate dehydrogenase